MEDTKTSPPLLLGASWKMSEVVFFVRAVPFEIVGEGRNGRLN